MAIYIGSERFSTKSIHNINLQIISYDCLQGSAILNCLECVMGEENTRKGYTDFLKTFQYSTAVVPDLWRILQRYAPPGVDITTMMLALTLQNTFALVNVGRNGNTLTLSQSRFVDDRNATKNKPDSTFQ